jgi:predicted metal-dependent hydrolase
MVGEPPPALFKAVEEFNRGEFFECHETLEQIWLAEPTELRRLYQGILQIGVAFHHTLKRKNYRGAITLLQNGMNYCAPFSPLYFGLDIKRLLEDSHSALEHILELGPERIGNFDRRYLPIICRVAGA